MGRSRKTPAESLLEEWGKKARCGNKIGETFLAIEVGLKGLSEPHRRLAWHLYAEGKALDASPMTRTMREGLKRDLVTMAWEMVPRDETTVWYLAAELAFGGHSWGRMLKVWADCPGAFTRHQDTKSLRKLLKNAAV